METFAYLSSSDDIKNRTVADWLSAHYSFGKPLHRYAGTLSLVGDKLQFMGVDTKNHNAEFTLALFRYQIEQLYYGFDDVFKMSETRGLGLYWHPIRIKITENDFTDHLYLITYTPEGFNTEEWYNALTTWCS